MFSKRLAYVLIFSILLCAQYSWVTLAQGGQTGIILADATLRAGASTQSAALGSLREGEVVEVLGQEQGASVTLRGITSALWYRVSVADGEQGYVWSGLIEVILTPGPTVTQAQASQTPTRTPSPTEPQIEASSVQPLTGELIGSAMPELGISLDGYGELTIENGQDRDAVVVLTVSRKPEGQLRSLPASPADYEFLLSFYLRGGETLTVQGVPDGTYGIFIAMGTDPQPGLSSGIHFSDLAEYVNGLEVLLEPELETGLNRYFANDVSFFQFEEPLPFETDRTSRGIEYTVWTLTLHAVEGGTAETLPVDPDDFPG